MARILLLIMISSMAYTLPAAAQNKSAKFKFGSVNSVALVNGDNTVSGALQTVNGVTKGKWFAGIGVALDYYLYRTAPVFVDLRREFGEKKNRPFVYADAGLNIAWVQKEFNIIPIIWNGNQENEFHNGVYTDAGFGMSVGMKNGQALVISLGYSIKDMKETRTYTNWMGQTEKEFYKYNLNRIILKMGWKF